MKVAIITPEFNPVINYNETLFARAFSEMGHLVRVITSKSHIFGCMEESCNSSDYEIIRLKSTYKVSSTYYLFGKEGAEILLSFSPQLIIAFVPDRGMSPQILKSDFPNSKIVSIFGDLVINVKHPIIREIFKRHWYRRVIAKSDLLMAVTPETASIIEKKRGDTENPPIWMSGLSYDGNVFYPSSEVHADVNNLRKSCKKVVGLITRIDSAKSILNWLDSIDEVFVRDSSLGLVIVGVDDNESWKMLKDYFSNRNYRERVIILGLQDAAILRTIYSGIEVSIWFQASIGIQQSLACGVPVVVPRENYLSHFIRESENSIGFKNTEEISKSLVKALSNSWNHAAIVAGISCYEKKNLTSSLLRRLKLID